MCQKHFNDNETIFLIIHGETHWKFVTDQDMFLCHNQTIAQLK